MSKAVAITAVYNLNIDDMIDLVDCKIAEIQPEVLRRLSCDGVELFPWAFDVPEKIAGVVPRINNFAVLISGDDRKYGYADLPHGPIASAFARVVTAYGGAINENIDPNDSPYVREAYTQLADELNTWKNGGIGKSTKITAPPDILPLLGDYVRFPSTIAEQAIVAATNNAGSKAKEYWNFDEKKQAVFSFRRRHGIADVSLRNTKWHIMTGNAAKDEAYEMLSRLDDLTIDVFCLLVAHYVENADQAGFVWVDADTILNDRGIIPKTRRVGKKRYPCGHRLEDREDIANRIEQLADVWITLRSVSAYNAYGDKKRRKITLNHESKYLIIKERYTITLPDGKPSRVMAWCYTLGDAVKALGGDRQFTHLARKIFKYDHFRCKPEKRLALYFAFHHRMTSGKPVRRRIENLFKACHLPIDKRHPENTRKCFDSAMDQLQQNDIIQWEYTTPTSFPPRKWLRSWLRSTVAVKMAEGNPLAKITKEGKEILP